MTRYPCANPACPATTPKPNALCSHCHNNRKHLPIRILCICSEHGDVERGEHRLQAWQRQAERIQREMGVVA